MAGWETAFGEIATAAKQDAQQTTLGAIQTAADSLLIAANAIKIAAEALNTKTTTVNTGAIVGTVALDAPTLAALETTGVAVSNFPATQPISGTIALDVGTLAALENTGVAVSNFPATQPISAASLPLPADAATETTLALLKAATDALLSATESINAQAETTTTLLAAMFEKMPRVTGNDQAAVSVEGGTVVVSSLPTLANVTTVGTVTTITNLTNQNAMGGKFISGDNAMMAGAAYIYNQITVS